MNRRKLIKSLVVGSAATGVFAESCKTDPAKDMAPKADSATANDDRMEEEIAYNKKLQQDHFFTTAEMATITVLADIIIPKDAVSGSASEAKVPDFIEFMVKDKPEHQTPMRGGLRWLDMACLKRFGKAFTDCAASQQLEMVNDIAYPLKAKKENKQGATFFSLVRNLTVSGFYTTEMGFKDLGYAGNRPNQWNGVPEDVLKQYNLAYSERELKECVTYT